MPPGSEGWFYLSSNNNLPTGESWNSIKLEIGYSHQISFTQIDTKLMPSPYKTNCFDYNIIGFKSRKDCIDSCLIEMSIEYFKCLPYQINVSPEGLYASMY